MIREADLYTERDESRDSLVADLGAIGEAYADRDDVLVESHLAHHLDDVERVIVLRCAPDVLEDRLRERGAEEGAALDAREREATENAEAESLDVILGEAVRKHGQERVYEIDTTDRTPEAVAAEIEAVLDGEREPSAGEVDFTEYLL
ncbi:adenylate kinase [Halarchaeum nitratireducens]|uniref:Adenylate kinase n=1 Tax=Halarchaeum nitratireducens TaxID=489913 RepID=A0A830GEC1_9EURY|nr:adenylate kinase [Halarchaeum nitratireducens]